MNNAADLDAAKQRLASAESFASSAMSGHLIQARAHAEAALSTAAAQSGPEWDVFRTRARNLLAEIEQRLQQTRTQSRGHGRGR